MVATWYLLDLHTLVCLSLCSLNNLLDNVTLDIKAKIFMPDVIVANELFRYTGIY